MHPSGNRPMVAIVNGLVNPIPPVKGGGPQIVIWNTCRELGNAPFDWRVLTLRDEQTDHCEFDRDRFIQVRPTEFERKFVAFTKFLPYRLIKSVFGVVRPDHLLLNLALVRRLKRINPDLIIIHESYSLTYMCHQWFPQKKILFYYHSSKMQTDLSESRWQRLVNSSTAGMIAICKSAFELTENVFTLRPVQKWVILNGVDYSQTTGLSIQRESELKKGLGIDPNDFVILYVGRILEKKGLDLLVESITEVLFKSIIPIKLVIVGSSSMDEDGSVDFEQKLRARANAIAPGKIIFTGFVPNDQLADYYSISDCGVLPTRLLEGNSLFLMECLCAGSPVIATRKGGVPEVVREGLDGYLIDEDDLAADLTTSMLRMINERKAWQTQKSEIAAAARERFNYQRVAQEFIQVVETVLDHAT